jgi:4-hydroxy-3-methylbut-2-enyl diphosphate reductase
MVFVRTAFFDILDMQGDRIVGKETLPILLGETRSIRLLKSMLMVIVAILFLSSALDLVSALGFALTLSPIFIYIVFAAHERRYMLPGIRLEFLIESQFVLTGVITLLWSLLN